MWRIFTWYIVLLLLIQAPLTHKHHRAEHYKKLAASNDVRWVWVEGDLKVSDLPSRLTPVEQHHPSRVSSHDNSSISATETDWTHHWLVSKNFALSFTDTIFKHYVTLYANVVWTPLIKLYLDGYSYWDDTVGFWGGLSESQICGKLKHHSDSAFWERNKSDCSRIVFERLNSFLETVHFAVFLCVLWSWYRSIHDATMYKTMMSGVVQEVKALVAQELQTLTRHDARKST
jgi:hypothetical protein